MATATQQSTMLEDQATKRAGVTTKRAGVTTKRAGVTTKRVEEELSKSGASGDYTVVSKGGEKVTIQNATIEVLDHGELSLQTDAGRWYLFAPGEWRTAFPNQPKPGQ